MKTRRAGLTPEEQRLDAASRSQNHNKLNKLNFKAKLDMLVRLEAGESATRIGKCYNVNESTVRYMRQIKDKLMEQAEIMELTMPISLIKQKNRDPCLVKMEQLLIEWIKLHKVSLGQRDVIRDKAQVFYQLICKENNLEDVTCDTILSGHWYKGFKNKVIRERNKSKNIPIKPTTSSKTFSAQKVNPRESTKPKPKGKRKTISLEKKMSVLAELEAGLKVIDVARSFNLNENTVCKIRRRASDIRRQHMKNLAKFETEKEEKGKVIPDLNDAEHFEGEYLSQMGDPCVEKMEILLWEWIERHKVSLDSPKVIFDKALVFYNLIRNENNLGHIPNPFKPTSEWFNVFKQKYAQEKEAEADEENKKNKSKLTS